jgi:UDP-GlcNAc:undecaprenyl-phosphate/decaprenyl-phosphate GlcNAc-1-phosphate transferase
MAAAGTFLLSFVFSLLLVPFVRWLSFRTGKVSKPRKDRWHSQPTPTLGGIGMFSACMLALLAMVALNGSWGEVRWHLVAASALIFGLGVLDDFHPLSPPAKLVVQIVAASLVIFFGRVIAFFPWGFANVLLTFFWLVAITNAINLLDNMDGLAAGISMIAASFLAYFFYRSGNYMLLWFALALGGAILGFLLFNFPPAKIFMGDSGSMFLGFTLASLAVAHQPRASDVFTVMGVPMMLFLLPILDTSLVTITRLLRGQSPAQGGTDHTSHRLIAFGLSERQTVLSLYTVGIISGVAGAVLEALDYDLSLVLIPIVLISLSLLTAYLARLKVVTSYVPRPGGISRLMNELTYKRRLFEMLLDFILVGVSFYLAFWTWHGFDLENRLLESVFSLIPIALTASFISFFFSGVYRGMWNYVGMEDLLLYARAAIGGVVLTALPLYLIMPPGEFSPVVMFLFGVFLFLGLTSSRASFQMLDRIYGRQRRKSERADILIFGAEDAGEIALRWIMRNPDLGYNPVGFLDDNKYLWGRRLHGVTVLGGGSQAVGIIADKQPDGVIITSPALLENGCGQELLEACRKQGVWIRIMRLDFERLD